MVVRVNRMAGRTFFFCVWFLVVMLVISACSNSNTIQEDPANTNGNGGNQVEEEEVYAENGLPKHTEVTLKVGFFRAGMGQEWFDYAMDTFKEKFPNVSFDVISSPNISDIIGTKISSQDDEDMFDLFNGNPPGVQLESLV
ncbi:hypothetical protein [Marinicrinis lubricantis]|uniref:Extracellular solute-binding protein n=1 Tax=Marinicrinis lubricantis TaxID=2086470 RepID=A0ABW1ILR1_9BACL